MHKTQEGMLQLTYDQTKIIKEGLVSRNEDEIYNAVQFMTPSMCNERGLEFLIKTDIPVLLSEAILPGFFKSNSVIYQCLRIMCSHKRFYNDGHALIVSQSSCRSAMLLINELDGQSQLENVLQLLSSILSGYNAFHILPDKMLLLQINDLLTTIVNREEENINNRYLIAVLLDAFFQTKPKFSKANLRISLTNLCNCYEKMMNFIESLVMDPVMDDVIAVMCNLTGHICRFLKLKEGTESHILGVEEEQRMVVKVKEFLVKDAVPNLMSVPTVKLDANIGKVTSLFQSLVCLLDGPPAHNSAFAQSLAASRLLSVVPSLLFHSESWAETVLKTQIRQFLWRFLVALAVDVFQFPEMWVEGEEHFVKEVELGVIALPFNPADWLSALRDVMTHRSVKLVILLYMYFHALIEGRLSDIYTYSSVAEFIKDLSGSSSRAVVVKIVWLILALSRFTENIADEEEANDDVVLKLTALIDEHDYLDLIYTHHPTILYYAFSTSLFTPALQSHVMRLWLVNQSGVEENDSCSFIEFLRTSERAKFAVLDLVQSGSGEVLNMAYKTYKLLLLDQHDEMESNTIWNMLPVALAKVCGQTINCENLEKVIDLALVDIPRSRELHDQVRIARLIPAAMSAMPVPPSSLWNLTHQLLITSVDKQDYQVVTCYLQIESFLQKVLDNISNSSKDIAWYSLQLAACLSNCQRLQNFCETSGNASLDIWAVIKNAQSDDVRLRHAAVLFLQEVINSNWKLPMCSLESPSPEILRTIFFMLQQVCFMDRSEESWNCLKGMLLLCLEEEPITAHFLTSRWLLHLIQMQLPTLASSPAMLQFLETWYSLRKVPLLSSRGLAPTLSSTVIIQLTEEMLLSFQQEFIPLLSKIYEAQEITDPSLNDQLSKVVIHQQTTTATGMNPRQDEVDPEEIAETLQLSSSSPRVELQGEGYEFKFNNINLFEPPDTQTTKQLNNLFDTSHKQTGLESLVGSKIGNSQLFQSEERSHKSSKEKGLFFGKESDKTKVVPRSEIELSRNGQVSKVFQHSLASNLFDSKKSSNVFNEKSNESNYYPTQNSQKTRKRAVRFDSTKQSGVSANINNIRKPFTDNLEKSGNIQNSKVRYNTPSQVEHIPNTEKQYLLNKDNERSAASKNLPSMLHFEANQENVHKTVCYNTNNNKSVKPNSGQKYSIQNRLMPKPSLENSGFQDTIVQNTQSTDCFSSVKSQQNSVLVVEQSEQNNITQGYPIVATQRQKLNEVNRLLVQNKQETVLEKNKPVSDNLAAKASSSKDAVEIEKHTKKNYVFFTAKNKENTGQSYLKGSEINGNKNFVPENVVENSQVFQSKNQSSHPQIDCYFPKTKQTFYGTSAKQLETSALASSQPKIVSRKPRVKKNNNSIVQSSAENLIQPLPNKEALNYLSEPKKAKKGQSGVTEKKKRTNRKPLAVVTEKNFNFDREKNVPVDKYLIEVKTPASHSEIKKIGFAEIDNRDDEDWENIDKSREEYDLSCSDGGIASPLEDAEDLSLKTSIERGNEVPVKKLKCEELFDSYFGTKNIQKLF